MAPLAGAVVLERERGIRYRRFVSLPGIVVIGQIVEDRKEHPPKPLAVVSAPLGYPAFEQISSVEPGGLRERSCLFRSEIFTPATVDGGECLLEPNDIDVYTVVERKLEPFGLSMQQLGGPGPAERNQPGVELPKRLAEVFPRIGRVLFAPEELGQRFPRMGSARVEREVREELLRFVGSVIEDDLVPLVDRELSKEGDADRWLHGGARNLREAPLLSRRGLHQGVCRPESRLPEFVTLHSSKVLRGYDPSFAATT